MRRFIAAVIVASAAAHVGTADAQKYFARQHLTNVASGSAAQPRTPTCAPGDHDVWVYPAASSPNPFKDYRKVGSAPDRSPALQTICADAIGNSNRTQCFVYGQGGLNVDVYVSTEDRDMPYQTVDRDNAIVYERIACTR